MDRVFLAFVGLAYLILAGWCSLLPAATSKAVGFDLKPGGGQSEFLTVYGGLELGLGLVFLSVMFRPSDAPYALFVCLVVHGCLVLFRSISFLVYSGIPTTTVYLAATEWVIFLASAALSWRKA